MQPTELAASVDPRVSLVFLPGSNTEDSSTSLDMYQPFIDLINPNIQILASANQNPLQQDSSDMLDGTLDMPANAVVLFLQEDKDPSEMDRLTKCMEYLSTPPWKFHHSEWVSGSQMETYPHNCHDYYVCSEDLPLCCVRQIMHGEEVLRVVKFVTVETWVDNVHFYSKIIGQQPDVLKPDYAIFTLEHHTHFDVQFSLKKLPNGVVPKSTKQMIISFKVPDIGALVPLLPSECYQLNASHWVTVDFDGNEVFLEQSSTSKKTFMGKMFSMQSIAEDLMLPQSEDTYSEMDDDSSVFHFSDRYQDYNQVLTSTPLSCKSSASLRSDANSRNAKRRLNQHQHTDSGFSEARSEQLGKSDMRQVIHKFCEVSLGELMSGDDKSDNGSARCRANAVSEDSQMDMTVKSAYSDDSAIGNNTVVNPHLLKHPEKLRPGHLHRGNKISRVAIDPKQSFTQLWVMNGHRETTSQRDHHSSDHDAASVTSYSSVETALSDPFSDRGECLAAKTRDKSVTHKGILLNHNAHLQGCHTFVDKTASMPCVASDHRDSASVSSSGSSSGTRKSKNKTVKFSEHIMEVTISPRVPSNTTPKIEDKSKTLPSDLRKLRVQNIINQLGQNTPNKKDTQPKSDKIQGFLSSAKKDTPARLAKIEERDKGKIGFWI